MEEKDIIKGDPVYTIGFNDGLEYSVRWIEDSAKGRAFDDATIPEFVALNAMSIRLAKEPVNQQDFYDALRADPEMYEKLRAEVERLREEMGRACDCYLHYDGNGMLDDVDAGLEMFNILVDALNFAEDGNDSTDRVGSLMDKGETEKEESEVP